MGILFTVYPVQKVLTGCRGISLCVCVCPYSYVKDSKTWRVGISDQSQTLVGGKVPVSDLWREKEREGGREGKGRERGREGGREGEREREERTIGHMNQIF